MHALTAPLMVLGASVIGLLGLTHLAMTFIGPRLRPRDPAVEEAMRSSSPRITRATTMWRAWVGFNASHSLGAILFGLVYGYLAVARGEMLFESWFLLVTGQLFLVSYAVLAVRYWFRAPLAGVLIANLAFAASWVVNQL